MSNLIVGATFTKNTGDPATGLVLAEIDFYLTSYHNTTGALLVIWNGSQHPTQEVTNIGSYARIFTAANLDTFTYFVRATYTGATVLDSDSVTGVAGQESAKLALADASAVAIITGTTINVLRGDTWSISILGLGDISARTMLWFTIKFEHRASDDDAIVQIEETAGLIRINGAAAGVPGNGSITVTDAVAGDITIALDEVETAKIIPATMPYDVQMFDGTDITTLTTGVVVVPADVTRATG